MLAMQSVYVGDAIRCAYRDLRMRERKNSRTGIYRLSFGKGAANGIDRLTQRRDYLAIRIDDQAVQIIAASRRIFRKILLPINCDQTRVLFQQVLMMLHVRQVDAVAETDGSCQDSRFFTRFQTQ